MGVKVSLTINVMDDGKVGVVGPLHDKLVCYGLLEVARDVVRDYKVGSAPGIVVPTLISPTGQMKKGN